MTEKTPEVVKEPTADVDEKTSKYKKKAQFTAITLMVIVIAGLVVQAYTNVKNREKRIATADAEAIKREANDKPQKSHSIDDFAHAEEKVDESNSKKSNDKNAPGSRDKLIEKLHDKMNGDDGSERQSTSTSEVNEESIIHAQKMADLKVALAAASSGKMGHMKYQSLSTPEQQNSMLGNVLPTGTGAKTNASEISTVDAKIKEVEVKKAAIERQIAALQSGNPQAAQSYASPAYATVKNTQSTSRTNALPNQTFGELATNRVLRDPGNSGSREGEALVPTGSILSGVLDTDMMSDYTGNAIAVLQKPFYDVANDNVIFPAGTKITLKTVRVSSVNEVIQNRMAITPQWIIRPDGKRIDLKRASGMDSAGVGALQDQVDRHILAQILGVGAYAILGLGPSTSNYGAEPNSSKDAFVRDATAQSRGVGRQFAEKYLNIVPTVTIRAGTPIKIFIEDDMFVQPWEPVYAEHFRPAK